MKHYESDLAHTQGEKYKHIIKTRIQCVFELVNHEIEWK